MTASPEYPGMFKKDRKLEGRKWLKDLPPEERKVFSTLGHIRLSVLDINWHSLGGKVRAKDRCKRCGKFMSKGGHECRKGDLK